MRARAHPMAPCMPSDVKCGIISKFVAREQRRSVADGWEGRPEVWLARSTCQVPVSAPRFPSQNPAPDDTCWTPANQRADGHCWRLICDQDLALSCRSAMQRDAWTDPISASLETLPGGESLPADLVRGGVGLALQNRPHPNAASCRHETPSQLLQGKLLQQLVQASAAEGAGTDSNAADELRDSLSSLGISIEALQRHNPGSFGCVGGEGVPAGFRHPCGADANPLGQGRHGSGQGHGRFP